MKKTLRVVRSVNLKMCYVAMVAMAVLMLMTTVNTIMRKMMLGGITDNLDLTEYLLTLIIFCGLAFLESEKGHVRVDMFLIMLPKTLKRVAESVWYLLSAGVLFMLFYGMYVSIVPTYRSGAGSQVWHVPEWPFTAVVTVAIFLYAFTVLVHLIAIIIGKDEAPEEEPESEEG